MSVAVVSDTGSVRTVPTSFRVSRPTGWSMIGLPRQALADARVALLQLRNEARQRGVKGRSTMNKSQLEAALAP